MNLELESREAHVREPLGRSLIFSLLLHLVLLFLFALFAFLDRAPLTLQTSLAFHDEPLVLPTQAALKPHASTFGTDVYFDDRPAAAAPPDVASAPQETIIEDTPTGTEHTPVDLRTLALQNLLATQKPTQQPAQEEKQDIRAATAGFLENLVHKGDDEFERSGDENIFPSLAEVKYLGYTKRVLWTLQKTWKVHFLHKAGLPEGVCVAHITIDKVGNVIDTALQSNNHSLQDLTAQHIHLAAPFPPLPEHFKLDTFDITITFHYEGAQPFGFRFM